jgi:hypothetical protein
MFCISMYRYRKYVVVIILSLKKKFVTRLCASFRNHVGTGGNFAGVLIISVAEPHQFYAAPTPGENFDPAPTLLYSRSKIF